MILRVDPRTLRKALRSQAEWADKNPFVRAWELADVEASLSFVWVMFDMETGDFFPATPAFPPEDDDF